MQTKWTSHLRDPKEKKDFEAYIRNSSNLLERLADILESMKKPTSKESDYESPSWAYKAADTNGFNRALEEVYKLTQLKETPKQ